MGEQRFTSTVMIVALVVICLGMGFVIYDKTRIKVERRAATESTYCGGLPCVDALGWRDPDTGCLYVAYGDALVPRLSPDGKQLGCGEQL